MCLLLAQEYPLGKHGIRVVCQNRTRIQRPEGVPRQNQAFGRRKSGIHPIASTGMMAHSKGFGFLAVVRARATGAEQRLFLS